MTVQELIEELQDFDPQMEVKFSYNFGDYWRTQVASNISRVNEEQVQYSSYHRMDKITDEDEDEDSKYAVILS
jgi:hypothetical protein